MQHVTVIIARRHLYCITTGWSWLLLVKRKIRTTSTTTNQQQQQQQGFPIMAGSHSCRWCCPQGWNFHDHIDNLCEHVSAVSCTRIMELFGVYIKFLRCGSGNLSTFWMLYMDTIDIVLGLIRASREGDWMLHLASVRAMIPWCFAYDRLNYARYLPCYNALTSQLSDPPICARWIDAIGVFMSSLAPATPSEESLSIKRSEKRRTRTHRRQGDQAVQFETRAVSRFYLTAEYRAVYPKTLRDMIGQGSSKLPHPDI